MRALILNSGMGTRMGDITNNHPKCMTEISEDETIVSRQLRLLKTCGITDVVMTTGYLADVLESYCDSLNLDLNIKYINNSKYKDTNAIYSIYCARDYLDDDIVLMHGDLVFTLEILKKILKEDRSVMTISTTLPLPEKDFKSIITGDTIEKISVDDFDSAYAAQPLYKVNRDDFKIWLDSICAYCEKGLTSVYAENAFNDVSDRCKLYPFDIKDELCAEIDNPRDLDIVSRRIGGLRK